MVPNFSHFRMMEATCALKHHQCWGNFLVSLNRSVPWHNSVSQVFGQFSRPHGSLTYAINCETLFRQVCAFPNYVQWIQLSTVVEASRTINRSKMHQSSIVTVITKGLNMGSVWYFTVLCKLSKHSKKLFLLCHFKILCIMRNILRWVWNVTKCGRLVRVSKLSICTIYDI